MSGLTKLNPAMCKKCLDCSETFSLSLAANKSNYPFKQGLNPDKKRVVAIAVRRQNAATTAKDIDKNLLTTDAVLAAAFLKVSVAGSVERVKNIPLDFLAWSPNCCEPFCVDWDPISFNETLVTLDTAATGFTAGHVIEFTVWYDCDKICKQ